MHGPDGRHIAAPAEGAASSGASILSHHDLRISDTSKFSLDKEGAVVTGCDVHSVIYKKGDPKSIIHREHNSYEPEHEVYGSHMMYREPGEYVITENVTMPGGKKYSLEFPIWVPAPAASAAKPAPPSPLLFGLAAAALVLVAGFAFLMGRRSGRRAAAGLSLLLFTAASGSLLPARAQEEEAGHMHGPDGRHIAVAETFGGASPLPLRAFLGPNREIEAFQKKDQYLFKLSIENEEMAPPDPDTVVLAPGAASAIGLELAQAVSRPLAGGLATTGTVRPNPNGEVTVNARVPGRIVRLNVTPGQDIPRGHLIAVIDSPEIAEAQAALSRTRSEQRQAEAAYDRSRTEVTAMQALVSEAAAGEARTQAAAAEARAELDRFRADAEVARARAAGARKTAARQQQLAAAGAFAQGPLEAAKDAAAAAEGELSESRASLSNLEARLRRLEQGAADGVVARTDLEAAQTAVEVARARAVTADRRLQTARAALSREENLRRDNLRDAREVQTARAELDAAELGVKSADAAVRRQEQAVEASEALITAQRRMVESARARVASARSSVESARAAAAGARTAVRAAINRLQLLGALPGRGSQVSVTAPIGGHIHSRPVSVGQQVAAGELLTSLVNTSSVWIESDVFEKDLPRVRVGQRVTVGGDALGGRILQGVISYISHDVDPERRAAQVRVVAPNPQGLLRPNMFVRVIVGIGPSGGVTVPLQALQEHGGDQVVFVAESGGGYRRRVVQAGPVLGDQVVIETGLKAGEKVVARGSYQLLAKVRK